MSNIAPIVVTGILHFCGRLRRLLTPKQLLFHLRVVGLRVVHSFIVFPLNIVSSKCKRLNKSGEAQVRLRAFAWYQPAKKPVEVFDVPDFDLNNLTKPPLNAVGARPRVCECSNVRDTTKFSGCIVTIFLMQELHMCSNNQTRG
jgi:hypothetical protein